MASIGQSILDYRKKKPSSTCEEIHGYIKKTFPGCRTTVASVACTLSRAGVAPGRLGAVAKAPLPTYKLADAEPSEESWEEAHKRINVRFDAMKRMGRDVIACKMPSLIISGPPGVGKSWTLQEELAKCGRQRHDGLTNVGGGGIKSVEGMVTTGWYDYIGGGCTAVGLYHALWNMRDGGVLIFDDCDDIFQEDDARNLLKIATDSTRERLVSWRKNAAWLDEYEIDKTFDFRGHIAFLTNVDFEETIQREHRDAVHFKALIDRAAYLCLTLRTARDFLIRIHDVYEGDQGVLAVKYQLDRRQRKEIMDFIEQNQKRFYNLSLRLVGQITERYLHDPGMWKADIEATKMKTC